ncbi:MAG: nucleotidyltransferase domain-containing protein [Chloroflexota bacterium]
MDERAVPASDKSGFLPVVQLAAAMAGYPKPWFVSGGWAIDLFAGRVTREHHDVEVGTFFPHQAELERHLADWDLFRIRDDAWEPLVPGEAVLLPDFQLQARSDRQALNEFDIFLNPLDGEDWVSRRHAGLRRRASDIVATSLGHRSEPPGIPFLVPEIQLLYKAKYHRPKDDADFEAALPLLGAERREWLRRALDAHHPGDPWIARL